MKRADGRCGVIHVIISGLHRTEHQIMHAFLGLNLLLSHAHGQRRLKE